MNPDTRYIYRKEPLSKEESRNLRSEQLKNAKSEIAFLEEKIRDLQDFLSLLKHRPLETEHEVQISLNPGDPGYDEAPVFYNPAKYVGDFTFKNLEP